MKQTWHGHSAFRIEAGEAKILIDSFLSNKHAKDPQAFHDFKWRYPSYGG